MDVVYSEHNVELEQEMDLSTRGRVASIILPVVQSRMSRETSNTRSYKVNHSDIETNKTSGRITRATHILTVDQTQLLLQLKW